MVLKRLTHFHVLLILIAASFSSFTYGKAIVKSGSYGRSYEDRVLTSYKIVDDSYAQNELTKVLLITEGVHGNEYMGITNKLTQVNYWHQLPVTHPLKAFLKQAGVIYILPKVNPDGIERKSRFTYNGHDLNRDFLERKLNQQESYYLSEFVKEEIAPLSIKTKISVDLHCCGGKLLQAKDMNVSDNYPFITVLRGPEAMKVPVQHTRDHFKTFFPGTLKDYLHENFGFKAFTFENFEIDHPLRELEVLLEKILEFKSH